MLCREVRQKYYHPKIQTRPLVYYCNPEPEYVTNAAMNLGIYLMLEHGFSPEDAVRPFARVTPSPLRGFRDATWLAPACTVDVLSCLRGLRKALDTGLLPSPHNLVDSFDCALYDACDEPSFLNLNQVMCPLYCMSCDISHALDSAYWSGCCAETLDSSNPLDMFGWVWLSNLSGQAVTCSAFCLVSVVIDFTSVFCSVANN
jgi:hypothetical protein